MKKSVFKNSVIYLLVLGFQKAAVFLLIFFYARFLSPASYGEVTVVNSIVALLGVLFLLGVNASVYRYYFDFKDGSIDAKRFLGTNITFLMFFTFLSSVSLILFAQALFKPFLSKVMFYPYMFLGIISAAFAPIFLIYQNLLQARQSGNKYGLVIIVSSLLLLVLNPVFVIVFKMKAEGPLLAAAIVSIVSFLYALWEIRKEITFGIDLSYLKKSLSYGLPIVPHALTGWIVNFSDKIIINRFVSTAVAGIYNVGYQIGSFQGLVNLAINQAYAPWFYEKMKVRQLSGIKRFFILIMGLYITLAMLVSIFSKDLFCFLSSGPYRTGWQVVGLISFGHVFGGYYYFLTNQLCFNKKGTRYLPIATVIAVAIGLSLNLVFIPKYGMMGAAVVMFFTNVITAFSVGWFANKVEPVDWDHFFVLKLMLYNGTACFLFYLADLNGFILSNFDLAFKLSAGTFFTYANYRLSMDRAEVSGYRELMALVKNRQNYF